MGKERSLVKNVYYVSPEYNKGHTNEQQGHGDDGPYTISDIIWDERDDFGDWLKENSLIGVQDMDVMDHNRRHCLFMGGEGVLCQMSGIRVAGDDVKDEFGSWGGTYRTVILVKYQPASKQIPPILKKEFDKREYVPNLKGLTKKVRDRVKCRFNEGDDE